MNIPHKYARHYYEGMKIYYTHAAVYLLHLPSRLGNAEHPFIAIAPKSNLAQNGSTW